MSFIPFSLPANVIKKLENAIPLPVIPFNSAEILE
jgi:hypothetical protein